MKTSKSLWGLKMSEKKFKKPMTKWLLAKQSMKIGMFFSVVFAAIQGFKIWNYFKIYPTTEFTYTTFQSAPQELIIKTQMLQTGQSLVYLSLFFYVLFEICAAFEQKEKHWLIGFIKKHKLDKKLSKFSEGLEDE